MASYLQNPDYQTYKVDPYQIPAQQIVQAIQTRNNYWDAGASQLKNAYQNFLNLQTIVVSPKGEHLSCCKRL